MSLANSQEVKSDTIPGSVTLPVNWVRAAIVNNERLKIKTEEAKILSEQNDSLKYQVKVAFDQISLLKSDIEIFRESERLWIEKEKKYKVDADLSDTINKALRKDLKQQKRTTIKVISVALLAITGIAVAK